MAEIQTRDGAWDELLDSTGQARPAAAQLVSHLRELGIAEIQARQDLADLDILAAGISFTVYHDGLGIDRAWPMDIVPRVIDSREWRQVEAGLKQRMRALNAFIDDVYNEQRVIFDGIFPAELLRHSVNFREQCVGMKPKFGSWAHVCGTDLVRDSNGTFLVLEDNLRVPSGVSYVLENRLVSKRAFADVFQRQSVLPVDNYPSELYKLLQSLAPDDLNRTPNVAVLTPGVYNSAYFEHTFLAQRMGVPLVEGGDLIVDENNIVSMRTISGLEPVDVIYRRVDDTFLDPEVFRPDSTLGVAGLMRAWKAGKVAIANAPGAGVADDKAVYAWVPDFIRYYLNEEPIIANVPTYRCFYDDERAYVLDHLNELVIKPANESGGYGLTIGDRASIAELEDAKDRILSDPRNWVAQPIITLSTAPVLADGQLSTRHLDLRPFILSGATQWVTTGGLTRVAMREGSLIVNSSQGGGSKDTWVVEI